MKNSCREYFADLQDCFSKIEARSGDGHKLDFEKALGQAVDWIAKVKAANKKVMFIGNGASASIASHQAVDLWKNGGVRATAFNDAALLTCISNDFGYEHVFEKPMEMFANEGDVLIAISSSGQSENILRAVEAAKAKRCHVLTLSGFKPDNPLSCLGHLNFYVPSGSYGPVEIAHLTICHYLSDRMVAMKQADLPKTAAGASK